MGSYFGGKLLSDSKETDDKRMFAISHHVSFVPTLPQGIKLNSMPSIPLKATTLPETKQEIDSNYAITPAQYRHYSQWFTKDPAFYQLFHPRNLGTSLPTPKPPPWESDELDVNYAQEPEWKHFINQNPQ